jgi:hypothetical protein
MKNSPEKESMIQPTLGKPRGILNLKAGEKKFQLSRYLPAPELNFFVEHYWIVSWDLRGQEPYVQETLPYPSVHLVIEQGQSRVYGVETGKFTRLLENKGRVFGIKFKPGGFYPFVKWPISRLTNATIDLWDVFGTDGRGLEEALLTREDEEEMVELAENFLRERLPEQDKVELGYSDQAHFIKDFKTIVGRTPAEYVKSLSSK